MTIDLAGSSSVDFGPPGTGMAPFSRAKIASWSSELSRDRQHKLILDLGGAPKLRGEQVLHGPIFGGKKQAMIRFRPGPPFLTPFTSVTCPGS
jgi:hypothetical protein